MDATATATATTTEQQEYTPRITAFLCNWCSYAGADLAGTSRLGYPANIIRFIGRNRPAACSVADR